MLDRNNPEDAKVLVRRLDVLVELSGAIGNFTEAWESCIDKNDANASTTFIGDLLKLIINFKAERPANGGVTLSMILVTVLGHELETAMSTLAGRIKPDLT